MCAVYAPRHVNGPGLKGVLINSATMLQQDGCLIKFVRTGSMAAQRFSIVSEVDSDLHDELERLGLGHISGILDALGVMQWDDLGLLSDDELAEAGVRLVQRKRLRLAAGNAASGLCASEVAPGASEPLPLLPGLVPR